MITVELAIDERGRFVSCRASGHSGFSQCGSDPVCAAVSVLVRTVMEQLADTQGLILSATAEKRGEAAFSVKRQGYTEKIGLFLEYAASFLVTGIGSVSRDFPEYVKLQVHTV